MTEDLFGIVGKVIVRTYAVRAVVAEGGFGVVYRAYHQGFRAEVALKCLKIPSELSEEQRRSFLEQFRSEAEVLFRLSGKNTNIVRPLHVDAFRTAGGVLVPFMAMEWLKGNTLDALIAQRSERGRPPLAMKKLVSLLTPAAQALEMAHNLKGENGTEMVLHRDMKPENLFVVRDGDQEHIKILDFGISKVKSTAHQMAGRASRQADALVSFSPAYGSPEQWAPRRYGQTGRWTDVWGLALTLVEAAKGFEVVVGDHASMIGTILDPERRPTPRAEGVKVSDGVEEVFLRALAVDPRQRFQSVGRFWDALTSALNVQAQLGGPIATDRLQPNQKETAGFDSMRPLAQKQPLVHEKAALPYKPSGERPLPAKRSSLAHHQDLGVRSLAVNSPGFGGGMASVSYRQRPAQPALSYAPTNRPAIKQALGRPLAFLSLSIALTLLDRAFAHSRGIPLSVGPIQMSWVAGVFMVLAIVSGIIAIRRNWQE